MDWQVTHRADRRARALADKHYSRKTPGGEQFAPPGYALVLLTADMRALWVSSHQQDRYAPYPGAWVCSLFRREPDCPYLASDLIRQAVAATRWQWGRPPEHGMLTFIDAGKIRHKRDPGRCFRKAGFVEIGRTKSGLVILQLTAEAMPAPEMPNNAQLQLWSA